MNTSQVTPWYRQFWPWFLIALPATAVAACIITIFIAVSNEPQLVNDNYYQQGLSINDRLKQQQRAAELAVQANLLFSEQNKKVTVYLNGNSDATQSLQLTISAPGNASLDQHFTLTALSERLFSSALQSMPQGRFYLSLQPEHQQWLLQGETLLPNQDPVVLSPQSAGYPTTNE